MSKGSHAVLEQTCQLLKYH